MKRVKYDPRTSLLAKIHIPDAFPHIIYRRDDWPGFAPDPSVFTLTRSGVTFQAMALWEPYDSEILQGGQTGSILVTPLRPQLWQHLRVGAPLIWTHEAFSAQVTEPLHMGEFL